MFKIDELGRLHIYDKQKDSLIFEFNGPIVNIYQDTHDQLTRDKLEALDASVELTKEELKQSLKDVLAVLEKEGECYATV